jgi:hypothetical protein
MEIRLRVTGDVACFNSWSQCLLCNCKDCRNKVIRFPVLHLQHLESVHLYTCILIAEQTEHLVRIEG